MTWIGVIISNYQRAGKEVPTVVPGSFFPRQNPYYTHVNIDQSTIHQRQIWSSVPSIYLDQIQSSICNLICRDCQLDFNRIPTSVMWLACLIYRYFQDNSSNKISSLIPGLHEFKRTASLLIRSHRFTVELIKYNRNFCSNIFFSRL